MHKNTKYACIFNKYAQNFTKYAQNGAFTNGTYPIKIKQTQKAGRQESMLIHINLDGKECLRIKPQGFFKSCSHPISKTMTRFIYFFNHHKLE